MDCAKPQSLRLPALPNRQGHRFLYKHGFGLARNCFTCADALVRLESRTNGVCIQRNPSVVNLAEYLTIKQAAELLGVAPNTMRNWDRDGKIPVHRHPISNYRLFGIEDLEEVLRRIEASGAYPSGWKAHPARKRKPR